MDYSARRAEQEREAARVARDERARRCHEQLAEIHSMEPRPNRSLDSEDDQPPARPPVDFIVLG